MGGLGVWHLLDTVPRPPHTLPGPQARPYTTNTFIGAGQGAGHLKYPLAAHFRVLPKEISVDGGGWSLDPLAGRGPGVAVMGGSGDHERGGR